MNRHHEQSVTQIYIYITCSKNQATNIIGYLTITSKTSGDYMGIRTVKPLFYMPLLYILHDVTRIV